MYRAVVSCALYLSLSWCLNLDSLYQLAQPGDGYDRLLTLDSFQVYEGGIICEAGKKTCIRGYGAIVDLGSSNINQILAEGAGTLLDVERCVIINGADSIAALQYDDSASGRLDHLTLVDNYDGVQFWYGESLTLKNSIIVSNRRYGVVTNDSCLPNLQISFNDSWDNQDGNYVCWFGSC